MGKVTSIVPIAEQVKQYAALRQQAATIKTQMDKLATSIKEYASTNGTKDDKGSFYSETDTYTFGKQAKKSVKFDPETAIKFFKDNKMTEAIDTVEVVNEAAVEKLIGEGKLSFEDLESITTTTTSYAIVVTAKEVMPEVEQAEASLPVAASKKPKLPKKPK